MPSTKTSPPAAGTSYRVVLHIADRSVQFGCPVDRARFVALAGLLLPERDRTRDDFDAFAHMVEPDDGQPWTASWANQLAEHLREHASHADRARVARTVGLYVAFLTEDK